MSIKHQRCLDKLIRSLKHCKNTKKYLQERAIDLTDVSRALELARASVSELKGEMKTAIIPTIGHVARLLDKRVLQTDIRKTAADVMKCGVFTLYSTF